MSPDGSRMKSVLPPGDDPPGIALYKGMGDVETGEARDDSEVLRRAAAGDAEALRVLFSA